MSLVRTPFPFYNATHVALTKIEKHGCFGDGEGERFIYVVYNYVSLGA